MSVKNSNDTIGNRTRDLPSCIAAPQSTAPPPAPVETAQRTIAYALVKYYSRGARHRKCTSRGLTVLVNYFR